MTENTNGENGTPIADALAGTAGTVRLWDPTTNEFVWAPGGETTLVEAVDARDGWTLATFDWPGRGRVWAGRLRLTDAGEVEARPESEFLAAIRTVDNPAVPHE
jgi:hypothetical protein